MKGDRLIERFRVGDNMHTKLNGHKLEHWGFILEINEFSIITSQDTIELKQIRKVLAGGRPLINGIGKTLILVGTAYFVIDQFNEVVVVKNDPSMDPQVWKPSAVLVGAGLPLLLFKKNWKRVPGKFKLISVGRDSRLYQSE
jgi:hypothetical protein